MCVFLIRPATFHFNQPSHLHPPPTSTSIHLARPQSNILPLRIDRSLQPPSNHQNPPAISTIGLQVKEAWWHQQHDRFNRNSLRLRSFFCSFSSSSSEHDSLRPTLLYAESPETDISIEPASAASDGCSNSSSSSSASPPPSPSHFIYRNRLRPNPTFATAG